MNSRSTLDAGSRLASRRALRTTVVATIFGLSIGCNNDTAPLRTVQEGPAVPGRVEALVAVGDKLYAGGEAGTGGAAVTGYVATWDGTTWTTLPALNGGVSALTEFDGALLAGGDFTSAGGVAANHLARWDGTTWSAFGAGTDGPVRAFLVQAGVVLFVGGAFTTAGGQDAHGVARCIAGQWSGLGQGLEGEVRALGLVSGSLIAGGDFSLRETTIHERNVALWDNASHWKCLAPGINDAVWAMVVQDNELVIGGDFRQADWVTPARHIAKLVGTGENWQRVGVAFGPGDSLDTAGVRSLLVDGTGLVAGGIFDIADMRPAPRISRWDQASWFALSTGMDASVDALTLFHGRIVAGGRFATAGGQPAPYIAIFDGTAWSAP